MRALAWILRIILFLALFLFALKNTDSVILRLYFDQVWQVPLILLLLLFFAAGAAIGVLATLATVFRQRREIAQLQREVQRFAPDDSPQKPLADGDAALRSVR